MAQSLFINALLPPSGGRPPPTGGRFACCLGFEPLLFLLQSQALLSWLLRGGSQRVFFVFLPARLH